MRARHYAFTPEPSADDSIAQSQTLLSAGQLSLDGAYGLNGFGYEVAYNPANLRPAWNITITAAGDLSAVNFTFTFLDAHLNQFEVTVAGPDTDTIDAGVYATRIISVVSDAAAADVSIGHTVVGYGPWKSIPARRGFQGSTISVGLGGTADFSIEQTFANICDNETFSGTFDFFNHPTVINKTTSAYANLDPRVIGYRLKINSWTSGEIRVDHAVAMVG